MADFSWFRLSHDWSERDGWLQGVSPVARLLWPVLLGKIRASNSSGIFKKPGFVAMARAHEIDIRCFEELWQACLDSGEVIDQGDDLFLLRDREIVMSPDAIRKEKEREEKRLADLKRLEEQAESAQTRPTPVETVHVLPDQDVSGHDRTEPVGPGGDCNTKTNTTTNTSDLSTANAVGEHQPAAEDPPNNKPEPAEHQPKKSRAPDERFERLRLVIARCHDVMGYDPPTDADVRRELKPSGPTLSGLLAWLEELPPPRWAALAETIPDEFLGDWEPPRTDDAAVAMWVHARRTWRGAVSWPAVYAQRDALVAQFAGARTSGPDAAARADLVAAEMDRRLAQSGVTRV